MKKLLMFLMAVSVAITTHAASVGDDHLERTCELSFVGHPEVRVVFTLKLGTTKADLRKELRHYCRNEIGRTFGGAVIERTGLAFPAFPEVITNDFLKENASENGTIHIQVLSLQFGFQ